MLLPEQTHLTIETGEAFFTAPFIRVYNLNVHARDGDRALISVGAYDKTPSGYRKGGSSVVFEEYKEITIPKSVKTAKKWLAKLALKLDKRIHQMSGCDRLNGANMTIIKKLKEV